MVVGKWRLLTFENNGHLPFWIFKNKILVLIGFTVGFCAIVQKFYCASLNN